MGGTLVWWIGGALATLSAATPRDKALPWMPPPTDARQTLREALRPSSNAATRDARLQAIATIALAWSGAPEALWLLLQDPEPEVRGAALDRVIAPCAEADDPLACSLTRIAVGDADAELAWRARDALLGHDPETALTGASTEFKIALLSRIAETVARFGERDRRALEILQRDPDDDVRELATAVADFAQP